MPSTGRSWCASLRGCALALSVAVVVGAETRCVSADDLLVFPQSPAIDGLREFPDVPVLEWRPGFPDDGGRQRLLLIQNESAEGEPELETDRDSFTPATTVVARGRTLWESSYSVIENREAAVGHSFPELLVRHGLGDRWEARLGWNFEVGSTAAVSNATESATVLDDRSETESQVLYGLKYRLWDQEQWLPQAAVIVQGTSPTSGPDNASDAQVGTVVGWRLPRDWELAAAMRYLATAEADDHHNLWAPSIVLKVPVSERWNIHAEYFGIWTSGKAEPKNAQYFSPGVHWLPTRSCEIGCRLGWGLNDDSAESFANVGIGWLR